MLSACAVVVNIMCLPPLAQGLVCEYVVIILHIAVFINSRKSPSDFENADLPGDRFFLPDRFRFQDINHPVIMPREIMIHKAACAVVFPPVRCLAVRQTVHRAFVIHSPVILATEQVVTIRTLPVQVIVSVEMMHRVNLFQSHGVTYSFGIHTNHYVCQSSFYIVLFYMLFFSEQPSRYRLLYIELFYSFTLHPVITTITSNPEYAVQIAER